MKMHALVQFQFQHTAARRRLLLKTFRNVICDKSFNTQPPEGGCPTKLPRHYYAKRFNTQPPEGGCLPYPVMVLVEVGVSTHSRPKAAASSCVSSASRRASFNTQPPEGGCWTNCPITNAVERFNTQPPEGGCICTSFCAYISELFQHTAARRRLHI